MAKVENKQKSLISMVKERTKVEFEFSDIVQETTTDGQNMVRFVLKTPIPEYNGRVVTSRRNQGISVPLAVYNVQYIRVNPEGLAEIERLISEDASPITWDKGQEGKSGKFSSSDVKFDISQSNLELWIVKTSLAAAANAGRPTGIEGLAQRIAKFKEEAAMKTKELGEGNKVIPESVATES